jgi:hypothetical protein
VVYRELGKTGRPHEEVLDEKVAKDESMARCFVESERAQRGECAMHMQCLIKSNIRYTAVRTRPTGKWSNLQSRVGGNHLS